ncbi:MAG: sugar kinase [Trueperaceae bacterium]
MAEPVTSSAPKFEVTSLGESLIRLSVGVGQRLSNARTLDVHVAGAESNVCAALAGIGRRSGWVSRVPDNPLGRLVLRRAKECGIDVEHVVLSPHGRMGTYFIELATPPVPTRVTYDRAGSAFTQFQTSEVDWESLLDTRILHLTGITPALSPSCRNLVAQAIERAKERGVLVSFDVNYRVRLWSSAQDAARVLRPLIEDVDLLLCGKKDAVQLFGLPQDDKEEAQLLDGLQALTKAKHVVVSLGKDGAIARSGGSTLRQPAISVSVMDRIGAGDAFAAGVIDGLLDGSLEQGLITGTALAALALSQHGDIVTANREDVTELVNGVGQEVVR